MKYFFPFLLFYMSCIIPAHGSIFRNYQQENGLSHNSVWTVMQDSEGFLWFGTNDGLNRFDGKEFKIYRKTANDPYAIGHNFIHALKEISKKRMLVGTRNGLYLYDRHFDRFEYIAISGQKNKEVNVNDILEDRDGNVWIACHGNGLYKLNSELQVKESFVSGEDNQLPSNYLWTIVTDHYGNLWIGMAGNGLVHFDPQNKIFTPITNRENLDIEDQSIYSIFCDKDNTLWIGTSTNGLFKYNHITGKAKHYLKNTSSVKAIRPYSENKIIMGTEKGLVLFDKTAENYQLLSDNTPENATNSSIFSIARDREGAFWIGTYFGGVNYFAPQTNDFLYYDDMLESKSQKYIVSGFTQESDSTILISTHNNNIIYRFFPYERRQEKAFTVSYNNIQSLLMVNDELYVSIYGRGIDVLSLKTGKQTKHLNINTIEGKSLFRLSDGRLIFLLEEGGCILQHRDGKHERLKELSGMLIADILQDKNGTVWFATYSNGLYAWNADGSWKHHTGIMNATTNFADNGLNCMAANDSSLWIGTKSMGIIQFGIKSNKVIQTFDQSNGLPDNFVHSILYDNLGYIWASTNEGIVSIATATAQVKTFGNIGRKMQYNHRSSLFSTDGHLFFGGNNGFIMLHPEKLTININTPPVVITDFQIIHRNMPSNENTTFSKTTSNKTKEIVLKHNQANFKFSFVSLSFMFPEMNQYAYMLEGFDNEWTYTTEHSAQYMNIPSGKYTFRVKGTNNDGIWSQTDTCAHIRIEPPFWLNGYMIFIYCILAISIVLISFKLYSRHLNKLNKEKEYKYQMAKEREMYESKIGFFTNIAHEIRTPLSLITAPLENIILSKDGNEQTKKNLQTIERNTNRLLQLVNQLLDFRKIENDMFTLNFRYQNVVTIVQKVYEQYVREAESKGIMFSLDLPEQKLLSYVDADALYKITSNLISNAIKFAKTEISLTLCVKDNLLLLSVKDDGIGIQDEYINKIFEPFYQVEVTDTFKNPGTGLGLSLSKSLAQKLRGDLRVKSEFGKGCLFTLELPILADDHNTEQQAQTNETNPDIKLLKSIETSEKESDITVLLVEDNQELRSFIHDALAEHYQVYEAGNGTEALDVIEKNNIDVIISDIVMPVMDGIELCNELKTNTAYSHIPIILLSAKTDTSTKIDGLKKGADVYMEKPFSIEQLKAQVSSIIEKRANFRKKIVESPLQYFRQEKENSESTEFIKRLNTFIFENMSNENFSIDSLSSEFAISRTNFQKKIKSITGLTPNDYIKLIRLNKSAELLSSGKYRVNEVCFLVGFNTPSYFSKCFYEHFGKLPKDFAQDTNK